MEFLGVQNGRRKINRKKGDDFIPELIRLIVQRRGGRWEEEGTKKANRFFNQLSAKVGRHFVAGFPGDGSVTKRQGQVMASVAFVVMAAMASALPHRSLFVWREEFHGKTDLL